VATVEKNGERDESLGLGFFNCCPLSTDFIGANGHHGDVKQH
jgi:hypothetical protein